MISILSPVGAPSGIAGVVAPTLARVIVANNTTSGAGLPSIPKNALTFSNGEPFQFTDGSYLEFSA